MMTDSKVFLVCGILVIIAVLATADAYEDTSVSKLSRVARFAEAEDRRKRKAFRNRRRQRKNRKPKNEVNEGYRKKKRNLKESRASGRSVDVTCVENVITVMRRWKDVVANFQKQKNRIEKQASIASKKSDKKAVFGPIALQLVELGGGNKSALTCGCSADTAGARQLTNLTRILLDLSSLHWLSLQQKLKIQQQHSQQLIMIIIMTLLPQMLIWTLLHQQQQLIQQQQ